MSKKAKNKPLIFLAEPSRILAKIITIELEKLDYEVRVFADGYSLLKETITQTPNLIISDNNIAEINGIELCKILKNGSTKESIPFILISTDDSIFDFWISSMEANRVVLITNDNIDYLVQTVNDMLSFNFIDSNDFYAEAEKEKAEEEEEKSSKAVEKTDDQVLASWVVQAMTKSNFFYNMTKNIIQLYESVNDMDHLVSQIFRLIYSACAYDIGVIILDNQPAKVFMTGPEFFEVSVVDEFWNICKIEYEQKVKKNHTITYEDKYFEDIILARPASANFESYTVFTIKNKKGFVGTIHLASCRKKVFNYKVKSSIEYMLPALGNILTESLAHAELTLQETRLRTAFSKFVPEEVINDFLSSDEKTELNNNNEKRNVVILMCDIRSFTSISEINKAEDVVNFLNSYFTHMVNIVKKYGGTVDKFIGDAIMVLFGAPISYNDNAQRAVQAAIEMYSQLDEIPCGNLKFPEGIKLDIGIGIHYGEVIVGQIGSADKTNYTVIGDTVNLASRLEGLTKLYGAKVVISEAVRNELDEKMNVHLLDSVKVKGKKEAVFIYRVDEKSLPEEFTEPYEKGFKSYAEGAFGLAIPYFEAALSVLPQDKAAKLMLERCNEFADSKPENWDGAIALTSK